MIEYADNIDLDSSLLNKHVFAKTRTFTSQVN